jgi:hypothetical protein
MKMEKKGGRHTITGKTLLRLYPAQADMYHPIIMAIKETKRNERRELMEQDFLDEMIAESTKRNPAFPSLMEEARQRRILQKNLAAMRTRARISQETVCLKTVGFLKH